MEERQKRALLTKSGLKNKEKKNAKSILRLMPLVCLLSAILFLIPHWSTHLLGALLLFVGYLPLLASALLRLFLLRQDRFFLERRQVSLLDEVVKKRRGGPIGNTYVEYILYFRDKKKYRIQEDGLRYFSDDSGMEDSGEIPLYSRTFEELKGGDTVLCFTVRPLGIKAVLAVFNERYYLPSEQDFRLDGDRYYPK